MFKSLRVIVESTYRYTQFVLNHLLINTLGERINYYIDILYFSLTIVRRQVLETYLGVESHFRFSNFTERFGIPQTGVDEKIRMVGDNILGTRETILV